MSVGVAVLLLAAVLGGCGVSAEPPASAAESSEAVSAEDETSGEASDELIRVENLRKSYGTINVLNGVSTSVRRGETLIALVILSAFDKHLCPQGRDRQCNWPLRGRKVHISSLSESAGAADCGPVMSRS